MSADSIATHLCIRLELHGSYLVGRVAFLHVLGHVFFSVLARLLVDLFLRTFVVLVFFHLSPALLELGSDVHGFFRLRRGYGFDVSWWRRLDIYGVFIRLLTRELVLYDLIHYVWDIQVAFVVQ